MQWHNGLLWAWNSALNPDILQAYLLYQQKMQRLSGGATLRIWAMFCAVSFSWKPGGILSTGVPMGRPGAQCSVHNRLSWMHTVTTMRTMRNTSIVILNDELWSTRSCDCIDESSHSPKSCASDAAKPAGAWEFANRTVAASSSQLASLSNDVASDSGSTWNRPLQTCRLANSRWSQSHYCREAVFHHQSLPGDWRFEVKKRLQAEKQQVQTVHVDKMSALTTIFLVNKGRVIATMCLPWPLLSAYHVQVGIFKQLRHLLKLL